jgi:NADPH:quinone reductase
MRRIFYLSTLAACAVIAASVTAAESRGVASIPKTMRAMAIDRTGGPDVLTMHTLPVPQLSPNEVLIAVHSAAVAVWDAEIRQRLAYMKSPRFPFVMGSDGAGVIAAVGSSVTRFKAGDEVYSYSWDNPKGGFYAEYIAVPADRVALLPKGIGLKEAGALGASGTTALAGIDRALRLKPGETLIIHGASGAVGTLAVQFAKLRGAKVLATASGADGVELVRRLGADAAVDGRKGDITTAARDFAPNGFDAVLALAAGDSLQRCMDAMRRGGRLAFPNGIASDPQPREGITIIPYDALSDSEERDLAQLNQAVEARKLEVPIAAEFPLPEAAKAHERLAAGHVLGKILLRVR